MTKPCGPGDEATPDSDVRFHAAGVATVNVFGTTDVCGMSAFATPAGAAVFDRASRLRLAWHRAGLDIAIGCQVPPSFPVKRH
jgi:hypothetical protein